MRWTEGPHPSVRIGRCGAWGLDGCPNTLMTVSIKDPVPIYDGSGPTRIVMRERWFCGERCREAWEGFA